mgnify:CR=1 FL=1
MTEHAEDIVQHRTRPGGDERDPLRRDWNRPFAGCIEEALCLQSPLQCLQLFAEEPDASRPEERVDDHLIATSRRVEVDPTDHEDDLAGWRHLFVGSDAAAEPDALERRIGIPKRQVLVPGRAARAALHLADHGARGEQRIRTDLQSNARGDLRDAEGLLGDRLDDQTRV